ncbi:MAG: adenine deaminase C-terminal domain-containing protein, partial [bacterium]
KMATINPARHFALKHTGAVAPGYHADFIVIDSLKSFKVTSVYKRGVEVARKGKILNVKFPPTVPVRSSINVRWLTPEQFRLPAKTGKVNAIEIVPGQLITKSRISKVRIENSFAVSDIKKDLLKLVVVERHRASGNIAQGFVKGFGLKKGAITSSVSHDSHNIVCVGCDDKSIFNAVLSIIKAGGGLCCTSGNRYEMLPLPVAGLMSDRDLSFVYRRVKKLLAVSSAMGCRLDDPFMTLSFLALPVIPELKITDMGLVNVIKNKFEELFV